MSRAEDILELAKNFANHKGYVKGLDSDSIAGKLHISRHDVIKFLHDLNSRGLVGFSMKSKGGGADGGAARIYRLRLTQKGLEELGGANGKPEVPGWPMSLSEMSDAESEISIEEDDAPPQRSTQVPTEAELSATEAAQRPRTTTLPGEKSLGQTPPRVRYPKINALLSRKRLAEEASRNLEALGADEMAIQALELVTKISPFEVEVLEFFVDHPEFVRFALEDK